MYAGFLLLFCNRPKQGNMTIGIETLSSFSCEILSFSRYEREPLIENIIRIVFLLQGLQSRQAVSVHLRQRLVAVGEVDITKKENY